MSLSPLQRGIAAATLGLLVLGGYFAIRSGTPAPARPPLPPVAAPTPVLPGEPKAQRQPIKPVTIKTPNLSMEAVRQSAQAYQQKHYPTRFPETLSKPDTVLPALKSGQGVVTTNRNESIGIPASSLQQIESETGISADDITQAFQQ